ncbi:MAG: NAD(P)-dependent oxidoreductase [Alphaproteobacteria bacterium]
MNERLGFIGMGVMGAPMALRLARAGYPLTVWNRAREKTAALTAAGAALGKDPADVLARSGIVHLCVFDAAAVEEVTFGARGLAAAGASPGKLVIDHSSIAPDATRRIAARLKHETGAGWIDAPVTGGVPGAEGGTLAIMAGGEAADVERLRPILAHVSQRVTHMGGIGAGQLTKLCNQMMVGGTMALIAEMLQLAASGGLAVERLPECLAGGYADSTVLQNFARPMAAGGVKSANLVTTLLKDLGNACAFGETTTTAMPMTALATQLYRTLYVNRHGGHDGLGILRLYRESPLTR